MSKTLVVYVPYTWPSVPRKFFESFVELTGPDISRRLREEYDVEIIPMVHTPFPLDYNRNSAVDRAIHQYQADYIQFLDGDMVFPKDLIPRLLQHITDETPVATGLYWRKNKNYRCVAGFYTPMNEDLEAKTGALRSQGFMSEDGQSQYLYYQPLTTFYIVQPVDVAGMGCLLARADVFKRLSQPYFRYVNEFSTGGDYSFGRVSEEMAFFAELKKARITVICDPSVRCGHLVEKVVGINEL
jgi:hypothetical protein